MTHPMLDRARLIEAFRRLGQDLSRRGLFIEIAVYGGSAIMMQFEWRRSTRDVDAIVREGYDEAALAPSVLAVAEQMALDPGWLNDAVGMFTPLAESDDLFEIAGTYPDSGIPGLRVLTATPRYLLALKLQAMRSVDRGEWDVNDARALAAHLGITSEAELHDLYVAIHGERPPAEAAFRFRSVLPGP
ncbi:hypothetical protein [Jiella sp. M17.18]|uniref:hypothetical protein n=1 Tax=Jiella sp. M17.18 TaxID=3234247 RepID=UPI0034DFD6FA